MSVQYQPSNPLSDSVNASNFAGSSISGDVGKSPAKTRRRSSVGVGAAAGKDMSPRTLARRTAKPRKSILKQQAPPLLSPTKTAKSPSRRKSTSSVPRRGSIPGGTAARLDENTYHGAGAGAGAGGASTAQSDDEMEMELELDSSPEKPTRAIKSHAHTMTFGTPSSGASASDGAHTISFPSTSSGRRSAMGGSTANMTEEQQAAEKQRKQERRERLAAEANRRKSVTFATHAHVRMFGEPEATPAGNGVMLSKEAAAAASGAASKLQPTPAPTSTSTTSPWSAQQSPAKSTTMSTRTVQGNIFAPPTMDPSSGVPPSRRASTGGVKRHGRQSSITELPVPSGGRHAGATITGVFAMPSVATGSEQFVSTDGEETMEMDIETDEEDEDGFSPQPISTAFSGAGQPFSFNSVHPPASARRTSQGGRSPRMSDGGGGDEDVTMDMDVTQIVSNGILSTHDNDADTTVEDSVDISLDNEEQTMDFTVAVGGPVPGIAPADARAEKGSIGYTVAGPGSSSVFGAFLPREMSASPIKSVVSGGVNPFASFGSTGGKVFTLPVMDGGDGDDSGTMDMEETVAMGGILSGGNRADESATTDGDDPQQENPTLSFGNALRGDGAANDDEDAMEFTVAVGGILGAGGAMPTFAMNVTSPTASSIEASGVHTPGPMSTTPRKDSAPGTPSFARPTAASEARSFQPTSPTPSPIAQPTSRNQTPTRLSLFSSGTPSKSAGTPRRALNDAAQAGNAIARSPYQGIMGSPVKSPAKRTNLFGTPSPTKNVSSRGNPLPSPSPSKRPSIAPSPARSPARSNIFSRAPVVEETPASPAWAHEGAYEQISLAAFLEMTGVQFMEGMPTGQRRKSIMPTGRDHARLSEGLSDREYSLSEYASGMVDGLIYNMYLWASQKLKADITSTQEILVQQDEDITNDNPPVIKEYLASADEDKALLEAVMHNLKTNAHLTVRARWYDWRQSTITQLIPNLIKTREGLMADAESIAELRSTANKVLPTLRRRLEALQSELAHEREAVAEIAECDQDELKELKAATAEQGAQISGYKSELSEATTKLSELEAKLAELNATKRDLSSAITIARKECDQQKGFGKGAIWGLRSQLDAMQQVHSWRISHLRQDRIEMIFGDEVKLAMDARSWKPLTETAQVDLVREDDALLPFLALVKTELVKVVKGDVQVVLHRIGKIWSTVQRLRAEFSLVQLRWPVLYQPSRDKANVVQAEVTVLNPATRSKLVVAFTFGRNGTGGWPSSLYGAGSGERVAVSVRRIYGTADPKRLENVASTILEAATEDEYSGIFLEVCRELAETH